MGGMVAVAHTDLPNGIIIVLACCAALPFVVAFAGGIDGPSRALPAQHFAVFSADFGEYPALKAGGYFLATLLLLMGIQSMYQKFYSAKSAAEARKAVALWIVGTILVETLVVVIAIYAASVALGRDARLRHRRHREEGGGDRHARVAIDKPEGDTLVSARVEDQRRFVPRIFEAQGKRFRSVASWRVHVALERHPHDETRGRAPSHGSAFTGALAGGSERHLELQTFGALQVADDFEEVARLWVALRAEHTHQALRRPTRQATQLLESDGGIDVVAQYRLARVEVSDQQTLDPFTQKLLAVPSGPA